MTVNIRNERNKIINKIDAKNLREKSLYGQVIQTLNAKNELESLPRNFTNGTDFCADITYGKKPSQKKTEVI